MDEPLTTCALVDQEDWDRRYLAGSLSDAEATAFEAHYFGCDRCWALVKGGAGIRSALAHRGALPTVRPRPWWQPLAVAAGLGIVAFGTWQAVRSSHPSDPDAIRGGGDSLAVRSELSAGVWHAAWPAVALVTSYRVRVFAEGGRLLLTREGADTSLGLPADSLAAMGGESPLYLEVEGFDQLRRPVVRSPLIQLRVRGDPR